MVGAALSKGVCSPFESGERYYAIVAPMVEQRTENSCVAGSSPAYGTKLFYLGGVHRIEYSENFSADRTIKSVSG